MPPPVSSRTKKKEEAGSLPADPRLENVYRKAAAADGHMGVAELKTALAELEVFLSDAELSHVVAEHDVDSSGSLSLEEFACIFGEGKLRSTFRTIDVDRSGAIDAAELHLALNNLGYGLPASEIARILKKVDADASGQVSFEEFRVFFRHVPASLAVIAKMWVEECPIDCGTDIAVPATSSDVPWWYFILGGIGGVMSRTLTAPLEKIKLQAQTSGKTFSPLSVARELGVTYQKLGVRGLFAGNMTNCLRVFPYAGIVTVVYLNALTFTPADNELDPMEPFYRSGCAALAGIVGQLTTYPIDVVRALMTVNPTKHRAVLGTFKSVVRDAGPRGLYKGLAPTLFAVMPFLACQMSTADALKSVCASRDVEVTTFRMGLVGGTAGIVAQSVVYPLDVLRRRMQMNAAGGGNVNVISDSTWLAMRQVVKREGVRSLFAGVVPTYMKVFPAVAIAMTTTKELIGYSKRNWE